MRALYLIAALAALAVPARAMTGDRGGEEDTPLGLLKISGGPWLTSSMGRWQTSFPLQNGVPKNEFGFGSTLEYNSKHDLLWLWSVELRPMSLLGLELQYADSSGIGGQSRDHDWLDAPNGIVTVQPSGNVYTTPHKQDMSLSQSDVSGRTTYASINAYGRVVDFEDDTGDYNVRQTVDVGLGYLFYDDRFRTKNLQQITSTGDLIATPPPGSYPGEDSTFHFRWRGVKFAFREETVTYRRQVHLSGALGVSPFMSYYGEGFWNLRAGQDFRAAPPSFSQRASGTLLEMRAALSYSPVPFFTAELGYMLVYLKTRPGTITAFQQDGTTISQDLDSAWNERKGWLAGLTFRY